MREVMHHGGLKHPFIVDLKEVFLTPEYLAIVMEYAQGGNVSSGARGGGGGIGAHALVCLPVCDGVRQMCVGVCLGVCGVVREHRLFAVCVVVGQPARLGT